MVLGVVRSLEVHIGLSFVSGRIAVEPESLEQERRKNKAKTSQPAAA
jgi:hypothetical protein